MPAKYFSRKREITREFIGVTFFVEIWNKESYWTNMDSLIKIGASVNIKRTDGKWHLYLIFYLILLKIVLFFFVDIIFFVAPFTLPLLSVSITYTQHGISLNLLQSQPTWWLFNSWTFLLKFLWNCGMVSDLHGRWKKSEHCYMCHSHWIKVKKWLRLLWLCIKNDASN